jgi:hypothetical protein
MVKIGLQFDNNIVIKDPHVMASHSTKNNNTCLICLTEFDQKECLAENLVCGH